jgi:hypothetical protein
LLRRGYRLPTVSGEERGLWARFTFAADVQVTIAESHREAASAGVRRGVTEVWNVDAHHDCGYRPRVVESLLKVVDCSTWLALYAAALPDKAVHVRYPPMERRGVRRRTRAGSGLCPRVR